MTDKELIQAVLTAKKWTQQRLADELLIDRTALSHIQRGATANLRPRLRQKCEQLLAEATEDK